MASRTLLITLIFLIFRIVIGQPSSTENFILPAIGDTQRMLSPGYPAFYSKTLWYLNGPPDSKIIVTFNEFDLGSSASCETNSVMVYTYNTFSDRYELVGTYCGSLEPFSVASTSSSMAVRIAASVPTLAKGINATATAISAFCGETFRSDSGVIEPPLYLGQYPNNIVCSYVVHNQPSSRIVLRTDVVDLGDDDYVLILKGARGDGGVLYNITSRTGVVPEILSYGDGIFVYFKSDATDAGDGFRLHFTVQKVDECLESPNGNDYVGTTSVSRSGLTCWFWNNFANLTFHENYCRNPFAADGPWCFVDLTTKELCSIPTCDATTTATPTAATASATSRKTATTTINRHSHGIPDEEEESGLTGKVTMGAAVGPGHNGGGNAGNLVPIGGPGGATRSNSNNSGGKQNEILVPAAVSGGIAVVVVALVLGALTKRKQARMKSRAAAFQGSQCVTREPGSNRSSYTTVDVCNERVFYQRNNRNEGVPLQGIEDEEVTYSVIENTEFLACESPQYTNYDTVEDNIYEEAPDGIYDHLGNSRKLIETIEEGEYGEIEGDDTYDHTVSFKRPKVTESHYDHLGFGE